ncbi:MAG: hypothetical protein WC479_11355 [Candidatus Izemoplasmatales bacterium]|jgi:hypothetical protein
MESKPSKSLAQLLKLYGDAKVTKVQSDLEKYGITSDDLKKERIIK